MTEKKYRFNPYPQCDPVIAAKRLDDLRKVIAHALDDLSAGLKNAGLLKTVAGVTGRAGVLELFVGDVEKIYGGEHSTKLETFEHRVKVAAASTANAQAARDDSPRKRESLFDRIL